jgi:tripartite motif-containing protein 71
VADTGNDRIQYFGAANGSYLGQFSSTTTVPLNGPTGVAIAPDGNVYVVDTLNYRVVYYTAEGICLGQFGSWGSGHGQFKSATGICIDQNYTVYVTDWQTSPVSPRVQCFTSTGSFLCSFGIDNGPYGRANPKGIISVDNRLYVSDAHNCRIMYYDSYLKTEPSSLGIIRSLYH